MTTTCRGVPKAIGAQNRTGVDNRSGSKNCIFVKNGIGKDGYIFTDTAASHYGNTCVDGGSCTDRYVVVVMVWDADQGTPIHGHDGKWCVECVYQGTIQVISYDLVGSPDDELVSFRKEQEVAAGRGEAGSLIPPFDYHVIENTHPERAVTIHVYGGEMYGCDVFQSVDGERYRRERKPLTYTK